MKHVVAFSEEDLAADFAGQVAEVYPLSDTQYPVLVSLSIPATAPLEWLASQKRYPQWYWQDRSGQTEIAGCGSLLQLQEQGSAEVSSCFEKLSEIVAEHPQAHLFTFFCGMAFDPSRNSSPEWAQFPNLSLCQPEIVLLRQGEEHRLILGTQVRGGESIAKVTRRLARHLQKCMPAAELTDASACHIEARADLPSREYWDESFPQLLASLESGQFQKLVIARRGDIELDTAPKAVSLLRSLQQHQEASYSFLYAPSSSDWFASKSPECLFRLSADRLECDALGGTAKMCAVPSEQQRETDYLHRSEKVNNEHQLVVEDVRRKMEKLTQAILQNSSPELVKLSHVQHLRSRLNGVPKAGVGVAETLLTLHPTAAVCGLPQEEAKQALAEFEPFDRGWYAGPVGMVTADAAEFAVALRCMLGHGRRVQLFGGAGIVPGSTAEGEWEEIENKMSSALELFR